MPAEFTQGFFVREPAWHGQGVVLKDYPGREEAMRLAGHAFSVIERPVLYLPEQPEEFTLPPAPLEGFKALVRDDTGAVFTVAPQSYTVVQNDVCWDIADAIANQPKVMYETGGTLKDGAIAWVLFWLDEPSTIKGDDSAIYPYGVVTWAHDGTGAVRTRSTSIRVVCWNTLSMSEAESARSGREFTFRHTKNVMDRIEQAREALKGIRGQHAAFLELAEELAELPVSDKGIVRFVNEFIPEPAADIVSDRVRANIEEARAEVRGILDSGLTVTTENRNTGWGLLSAGVEYLDHIRGFRSRDTYLGRTLLRDEPLKARLVPLIRRIAEEDAERVKVA